MITKKLLYCLIALGMLALVGCENDESISSLVGTWDLVTVEIDGESYPANYESSIHFTRTTVTIYDEEDIFNGVPTEYEYKNNTIWIMGAALWKVVYLDDNTLKLKIDDEIQTYQKR